MYIIEVCFGVSFLGDQSIEKRALVQLYLFLTYDGGWFKGYFALYFCCVFFVFFCLLTHTRYIRLFLSRALLLSSIPTKKKPLCVVRSKKCKICPTKKKLHFINVSLSAGCSFRYDALCVSLKVRNVSVRGWSSLHSAKRAFDEDDPIIYKQPHCSRRLFSLYFQAKFSSPPPPPEHTPPPPPPLGGPCIGGGSLCLSLSLFFVFLFFS